MQALGELDELIVGDLVAEAAHIPAVVAAAGDAGAIDDAAPALAFELGLPRRHGGAEQGELLPLRLVAEGFGDDLGIGATAKGGAISALFYERPSAAL